jgi:hypothetical protein
MTPTEFTAYFENIATLHQSILHHATNSPRFFQVVQSADPITGTWSIDFQNALRSRSNTAGNKALMVLEHYDANYRYNAPNNILLEGRAAFLILKKPADKTISAQVQAVTDCQTIGEQIIGYIENDSLNKWQSGNAATALFHQFEALSSWSVVNVSDFWGRRFEFSFFTPQGDTLLYNATPFTPPGP